VTAPWVGCPPMPTPTHPLGSAGGSTKHETVLVALVLSGGPTKV
jgi:hypothetical protein